MGSEIFVMSVCGYSGGYDEKAKKLTDAGFVCLREIRKTNGIWKWIEQNYWEVWFLPYLGHHNDNIHKKDNPILTAKNVDEVCRWLMNHIGPGNIIMDCKNIGLGAD